MRYLIGFLLVIGFIVLVFILIFKGFNSGGGKTTTKPLVDYANSNTTVQMTIDGPVNANQTHYELQMVVGSSQSQMNLMQGYEGNVVQSKTYTNNASSYAEFLRALDLAGYNQGVIGSGVNTDPRGYCPFGQRYTYEIVNGSTDIQNFWATSCGGQGTFKGNATAVKRLFIAQMPDFSTVASAGGLN